MSKYKYVDEYGNIKANTIFSQFYKDQAFMDQDLKMLDTEGIFGQSILPDGNKLPVGFLRSHNFIFVRVPKEFRLEEEDDRKLIPIYYIEE